MCLCLLPFSILRSVDVVLSFYKKNPRTTREEGGGHCATHTVKVIDIYTAAASLSLLSRESAKKTGTDCCGSKVHRCSHLHKELNKTPRHLPYRTLHSLNTYLALCSPSSAKFGSRTPYTSCFHRII